MTKTTNRVDVLPFDCLGGGLDQLHQIVRLLVGDKVELLALEDVLEPGEEVFDRTELWGRDDVAYEDSSVLLVEVFGDLAHVVSGIVAEDGIAPAEPVNLGHRIDVLIGVHEPVVNFEGLQSVLDTDGGHDVDGTLLEQVVLEDNVPPFVAVGRLVVRESADYSLIHENQPPFVLLGLLDLVLDGHELLGLLLIRPLLRHLPHLEHFPLDADPAKLLREDRASDIYAGV